MILASCHLTTKYPKSKLKKLVSNPISILEDNKVLPKNGNDMKQKLVVVDTNRLTACALIKRIGFMAALSGTLSACGTIDAPAPTSGGRILISADAKGMQAFGDVFNGAITNGKATADRDTAHWQLRKKQAREETVQRYAPSFLGGIFGTETTSLPVDQEPTKPAQVVGADQGAIVKE